MRLLTPLLVLLLIGSLIVNGIMAVKIKNKRPIFSVNGQGVTKKDMDDYLEQKEGQTVKAEMAKRMLIDQEAKKEGVLPTDAEVKEAFDNLLEDRWDIALQVNRNPWLAEEQKKDVKMQLAATRIVLHDIPVQDSEMKEVYDKQAPLFDTPDKARGSLAVITDQSKTQEVITLLSKNPPVAPAAIMTQFPNQVIFIGNESKFTFKRPFQFSGKYSNKPLIDMIYAMKPGDVKQIPMTGDVYKFFIQNFRQQPKALVFKMLEIVPGHKADLNDPKVKEGLRSVVASKRAKPFEEILSGIWAKTDFQSDSPDDKKYIEMLLFPTHQKAQ